ncbi:MAG: hypothetical protein MJ131_06850 [Lachnospiraceae bacterium]|nr:hypothetical protein [Lachnospiraceae bacterium]
MSKRFKDNIIIFLVSTVVAYLYIIIWNSLADGGLSLVFNPMILLVCVVFGGYSLGLLNLRKVNRGFNIAATVLLVLTVLIAMGWLGFVSALAG